MGMFTKRAVSFFLFIIVLLSVTNLANAQGFQASVRANPNTICDNGDVYLYSAPSTVAIEAPVDNENHKNIQVSITFNSIPDNYSITKAPLKYNKMFSLGAHLDDGAVDLYTHAYPFFNGGEVEGTSYPGLFYTDGCGNDLKFKMSTAIFPLKSDYGDDQHDPTNPDIDLHYLTWDDVVIMYNEGWGVYNHGTSGLPPENEYGVERAHSFIKKKLYEFSSGNILCDPKLFVNPNGWETYTPFAVAAEYELAFMMGSNHAGHFYYPAEDGWPDNIGNFARIGMNNTSDHDLENPGDLIDFAADSLYKLGVAGSPGFKALFNHNVVGSFGDLTFDQFKEHWNYVADTYGKDGLDAIWMTIEEEAIAYIDVNQSLEIIESWNGNTLTLSFDGDIPDDIRFYATSLLIDADTDITGISVSGSTFNSYNVDNSGTSLINIDWDGKTELQPVHDALEWIQKARENASNDQALIAADYIDMIDDEILSKSLKAMLCEIPGVNISDGYCDDITIDYTYQWTSDPAGFTSNDPNPVFNIDETTEFTVVISNGVTNAQKSVLVEVNAIPEVETGSDQTLCGNELVNVYSSVSNYSSVLWTTNGTGTFADAKALNTQYTPSDEDVMAGNVVLTMTARNTGCIDPVSDDMLVTFLPSPSVTLGDDDETCSGQAYDLTALVTDADSVRWSTSGDGVFDNPNAENTSYTPGEEDANNGTAELTLTVFSDAPCFYELDDKVNLTITYGPDIEVSADTVLCPSATEVDLSAVAEYYQTLTWSSTGDGSFDTPNAETTRYVLGDDDLDDKIFTITLTAAPIAPCNNPVSKSFTATIGDLPVAYLSTTDTTVCAVNPILLNGSSDNAERFLWSDQGAGGYFSFPGLESTAYNPSQEVLDDGAVTVRFTAMSPIPCNEYDSKTMNLNIPAQPSVNIVAGEDTTLCGDYDFIELIAESVNPINPEWTTNGSGVFSNTATSTTQYSFSEADKAMDNLYIYINSDVLAPCEGRITDSIHVIFGAIADAHIAEGDEITTCKGDPVSIELVADNYSSILWETAGNGSFSNSTLPEVVYTPGNVDLNLGFVDLTARVIGIAPCSDTLYSSIRINYQDLPEIDLQDPWFLCVDSDFIELEPIVSYFDAVEWTSAGTGAFSDNEVLQTRYYPSDEDRANGSVSLQLVVSTTGSCDTVVNESGLLTFTYHETIDAGSDQMVCEDAFVQLQATGNNISDFVWSTSGSGTFSDPNAQSTVYFPSHQDGLDGDITITVNATEDNLCGASISDFLQLDVRPAPSVDAGPDQQIYAGQTALLSGSVANAGFYQWTVLSGGSVDDPLSLTPEFTPNDYAIENGQAMIMLKAWAEAPCSMPARDTMMVFILPLPEIDAGEDQLVCESESEIQLSPDPSITGDVEWQSNGLGSFADAGVLNAIYYPAPEDLELNLVLTLINTTPEDLELSDFIEVDFVADPNIDLGDDFELCNGESVVVNPVIENYVSLQWTTNGTGVISNPTSPILQYAPSDEDYNLDEIAFYIEVSPQNPCSEIFYDTVLCFPQEGVTLSVVGNMDVCEDQPEIDVIATSNIDGDFEWTSNGDGAFGDPNELLTTYSFGANDLLAGSVVLTISAEGNDECNSTDEQSINVSISPVPVVDAGEDEIICEQGESLTLSASCSSPDYSWTTNGDGTFTSIETLTPEYTPVESDWENGVVEFVLEGQAVAPCTESVTDTLYLYLYEDLTVDLGEDQLVCAGTTSVPLVADSNNENVIFDWTTSGDGSFSNPNSGTTNYLPGTEDLNGEAVTISLTISDGGPCLLEASDDMILNISAFPTGEFELDELYCPGIEIYLAGTASSSNVLWSTNGSGDFYPQNDVLITNYQSTLEDATLDELEIYLTVYNEDECGDSVIIVRTTNFESAPGVTIDPITSYVCSGTSIELNGTVENCQDFIWDITVGAENASLENDNTLNPTFSVNGMGEHGDLAYVQLTGLPESSCFEDSVYVITIPMGFTPYASDLPSMEGPFCQWGKNRVEVSFTNEPYIYYWFLEPEEAGTYSVATESNFDTIYWNTGYVGEFKVRTLAKNQECGAGDTSNYFIGEVFANPTLSYEMIPEDGLACYDEVITISAESNGEVEYLWISPVETLTDQVVILDSTGIINDTLYVDLSITNEFGCSTSEDFELVYRLCETVEELKGFGIDIYPVPANDQLFVSIGKKAKAIQILDMQGRILEERKLNEGQLEQSFRTLDYAEGMYLLRVIRDKEVITGKFIIKH